MKKINQRYISQGGIVILNSKKTYSLTNLFDDSVYAGSYPVFVQNIEGETVGFANSQEEYVTIFNQNSTRGEKIEIDNSNIFSFKTSNHSISKITGASISEIKGWYDITDDSKVTENGSNDITSIANKLGNYPSLTNTGGVLPKRMTGGFNGLKYAKIVSTSEIFATQSVTGTELTILMAYKPNSSATGAFPMCLNGSGSSGLRVANRFGRQAIELVGTGSRVTRPSTMLGGWKFASFQFSNTAGISTTAKVNREPFDDYSYERATTGVLPLNAQNRVGIGWRATQTIDFDICEVMYIDKILTDQEHKVISDYLHNKYNPIPVDKVGVIGDSVSYGAEATPYENNGFAYLFADQKNMYLDTFAYPGGKVFEAYHYVGGPVPGLDTTEDSATIDGIDFIDKIEKLSNKDLRNYKYWLIAYNYNDSWAQNADSYADAWIARYKILVERLIALGFNPDTIIIGTGPYHSSRTSTQARFDTRVQTMCTQLGCKYVDYTSSTLAAGGDAIMVDAAHPNAAGHIAMKNAAIAVS